MLKLDKPSIEHIAMYTNFMDEWKANSEEIIPSSARLQGLNYEDWVNNLKSGEHKESCPPELVPASTYFLIEDEKYIVGIINIRHELNSSLINIGGHIGYGIRPNERRKGYAKELLKMGLVESKLLGLDQVLITCDKKNVGSAKTIIANGGLLENELESKERITQRYWIQL